MNHSTIKKTKLGEYAGKKREGCPVHCPTPQECKSICLTQLTMRLVHHMH